MGIGEGRRNEAYGGVSISPGTRVTSGSFRAPATV